MKAKLILQNEGNTLSGPYSIINQVKHFVETCGIPVGYVHLIHNIEFTDKKVFQICKQGNITDCDCFLLTLKFEAHEILRVVILFIGEDTLSIYTYANSREDGFTEEYKNRKSLFVKLPDEDEFIKFILSVPMVNK